MNQFTLIINAIIAVVRSFIRNQQVVEAIKAAALEAVSKSEWSEGEKTFFVLEAGRKIVAATPSVIDDMLYSIVSTLYVKKYMGRAVAGTGDTGAGSKPDIAPAPERSFNIGDILTTQPNFTLDIRPGEDVYQHGEDSQWTVRQRGINVGPKLLEPWRVVYSAK